MNKTHLLYAFPIGALIGALVASNACAETKERKPSVCADFTETVVADKSTPTGKRKVGICYDSKRPRVFTYWTYVTVESESGPHKYAVGG